MTCYAERQANLRRLERRLAALPAVEAVDRLDATETRAGFPNSTA